MNHQFPLTITSLGREIYKGTAEMVVLPGETGVFDVLAAHETTIEFLKEGNLKIVHEQMADTYRITHGFASIARGENNEFSVNILVDDEAKLVNQEGVAVSREQER